MSVVPSGAQTYSKSPSSYPDGTPHYADRGEGGWVWDKDGRRYVDSVAALGAILLGHGNEAIHRAARQQMERGVSFSLATEQEARLSRRLVDLVPGADMCRFGKNGADVVNAAVRLARAHTGRDHVLRGSYHGHSDWCIEGPMDGGVLPVNAAKRTKVDIGDLPRLIDYVHDLRPAALVVEPCASNDPQTYPPEHWRKIRELLDETGTLLILDEMVTAFRMGYPGGVSVIGVEPDLWCGAKALGGGFPITCLLGSGEIMERLETDVFYSTTFAGEAVSIAAASACLDEMENLEAAQVVGGFGAFLQDWMDLRISYHALAGAVKVRSGYPARLLFEIGETQARRAFRQGVTEAGMLCQGYVNVMVAHAADEECSETIREALDWGLQRVQETI